MMASIRQQIESLDLKMAELQRVTFQQEQEIVPIDLNLDSFDEDDLPFDNPEPEQTPEPEQVAEPQSEQTPEPVFVAEPQPEPEQIPEPVQVVEPEPEPAPVRETIIDAMTEKQAWRTDMPGSPVRDVRLAISLHERVLFINHLFSEDPMAFQAAINRINASESLDMVVEYIKESFPDWNLDSDIVYRFMMAVRRKIR